MGIVFNTLIRIVAFGTIVALGLLAAARFYAISVAEFSVVVLAVFTVKLAWHIDDLLAERRK